MTARPSSVPDARRSIAAVNAARVFSPSGSARTKHTAIASMYLQYVYFGTTALFAGVIFLNATVTKWTSPYMTLQALNEIAWVFFLGLYVFVYALVEPGR
jgi:hypothetical protein